MIGRKSQGCVSFGMDQNGKSNNSRGSLSLATGKTRSRSSSRPSSPLDGSSSPAQGEGTIVNSVIQLPLRILGYMWSIFSPPAMSLSSSESLENVQEGTSPWSATSPFSPGAPPPHQHSRSSTEGTEPFSRHESVDEDAAKLRNFGMPDFPVLYDPDGKAIPTLDNDQVRAILEDGSPIQLVGREEQTEEDDRILTEKLAQLLKHTMPPKARLAAKWRLLYSTFRDGFSLSTLYSNSKRQGHGYPCVLVVKDMNNAVFGAFTNENWGPRIGHYGTGECFLWKLVPFSTTDSDQEQQYLLKPFKTTTKNMFYMISEPQFMAIGCGESLFGLWLDDGLLNGVSNSVPTFDNEILSSKPKFQCIGLELWELDLDS